MEQALQAVGICVAAALLALTVRRGSPELALVLGLATVVLVLLRLMDAVGTLMAFLREMGQRSGISGELFLPLYKTMGIALVVRVGSSLCRDAGESALASVVETAGTVCALVVAFPLLEAVLGLLTELMG